MPDVIQIRYLVLCDHADAEGGKHYISGAGMSNIPLSPQGPQSTLLVLPRFGIALAVDVPYSATSEQHTIRVTIEDGDGQPMLPQPMEAQFESGRPPGMRQNNWLTAKMAFNIQGLQFPREGIYSVVVEIDGTESTRQSLYIQKMQLTKLV